MHKAAIHSKYEKQLTIKQVPPNTTHSEHFGKHPEHVDNNSETQDIFLKLLNILTSHLEWKLQWTDSIGNSKKLLNLAHGLQTKETDKYTENTSRRTMLAMDTTGPLEYGLLEYDKTDGS